MKRILCFAALSSLAAFASASPAHAQDMPNPREIYIESVQYNGDGCPPGTAVTTLALDASAVTTLFNAYGVDSTAGINRRVCNFDVRLRTPAGWSYALYSVDFRGYANVDPTARAVQTSSYRFDGRGSYVALGNSVISGPYSDDYLFRNVIPVDSAYWSPCEVSSRTINLATSVEVSGRAAMTVDSIDGSLEHHYALKWRHCPQDPTEVFITRTYRDLLGRAANVPEVNAWSPSLRNGSLTRQKYGLALITSPEGRSAEVAGYYRNYLGRNPAPQEVAAWVNALAAGQDTDAVQAGFLSSDEFYRRQGSTPIGFIVGLYQYALGRTASPQEINAWVPQLARSNRGAVAAQFIKSPENRRRLVDAWYRKYLRRAPDATGIAAWSAAMNGKTAQESVQSQLIGSDEYFRLP